VSNKSVLLLYKNNNNNTIYLQRDGGKYYRQNGVHRLLMYFCVLCRTVLRWRWLSHGLRELLVFWSDCWVIGFDEINCLWTLIRLSARLIFSPSARPLLLTDSSDTSRQFAPWKESPCTLRETSWAGWCRCEGRRRWTRTECWIRVRRTSASPAQRRGTGTTTVEHHPKKHTLTDL